MQEVFGQIIHVCFILPQVGYNDKLEGPKEQLWISPSDQLMGKVVLTEPYPRQEVQAMTHQNILGKQNVNLYLFSLIYVTRILKIKTEVLHLPTEPIECGILKPSICLQVLITERFLISLSQPIRLIIALSFMLLIS